MTQEKIEEILFDINTTLGKIETKLSGVCEVLAKHEQRITTLETSHENRADSWKNELLMLLAKAVIIGLTSIATLVGGGSLVSQILAQGNQLTTTQICK